MFFFIFQNYKEILHSKNPKTLIFNLTGDREAVKLMNILTDGNNFSLVCYTPNTAFGPSCKTNVNNSTSQTESEKINKVLEIAKNCQNNFFHSSVVTSSVFDGLDEVSKVSDNEGEVDVLVTGSTHLIGATLLALEKFSIK